MKLREYVENLTKLIQDHPAAADLDVVASEDAEGNGYNPVYCAPSLGHYDSDEGEFYPDKKINAICIN